MEQETNSQDAKKRSFVDSHFTLESIQSLILEAKQVQLALGWRRDVSVSRQRCLLDMLGLEELPQD